jgi:hypothetical protein
LETFAKTGKANVELDATPLPSAPVEALPQHSSAPVERTAQVWLKPAAMPVALTHETPATGQAFEHLTVPLAHAHAPLAQTWPPVQVKPAPQPPQFVAFGVLLVVSFTQAPLQDVWPDGQVHELVPGPVIAHVAPVGQPPLFVWQGLIAVHVVPVPEKPVLHAQLFVPGPVDVQFAFTSQPPLFVRHELIAVHVVPDPE